MPRREKLDNCADCGCALTEENRKSPTMCVDCRRKRMYENQKRYRARCSALLKEIRKERKHAGTGN